MIVVSASRTCSSFIRLSEDVEGAGGREERGSVCVCKRGGWGVGGWVGGWVGGGRERERERERSFLDNHKVREERRRKGIEKEGGKADGEGRQ
jgi:hypothetical protein